MRRATRIAAIAMLGVASTFAIAGCATVADPGQGPPSPSAEPASPPPPSPAPATSPPPTSPPASPEPDDDAEAGSATCEEITPPEWLAGVQERNPSVAIPGDIDRSVIAQYALEDAVTDATSCVWGPADEDLWGDVGIPILRAVILDRNAIEETLRSEGFTTAEATTGVVFYQDDPMAASTSPFWIDGDTLHWAHELWVLEEWTGVTG